MKSIQIGKDGYANVMCYWIWIYVPANIYRYVYRTILVQLTNDVPPSTPTNEHVGPIQEKRREYVGFPLYLFEDKSN